jgi:hypothetical protein
VRAVERLVAEVRAVVAGVGQTVGYLAAVALAIYAGAYAVGAVLKIAGVY